MPFAHPVSPLATTEVERLTLTYAQAPHFFSPPVRDAVIKHLRAEPGAPDLVMCGGHGALILSGARREGAFFYLPGVSAQTLRGAIYIFSHSVCLERGSFFIHAAAVAKAGKVWLFTAEGGGGKSTVARLAKAAGLTVLSDDMVLIQREGDEYFAYGTPFAQYTDGPHRGRVMAVYYLDKANAFDISAAPRQQWHHAFRDHLAHVWTGLQPRQKRALFQHWYDLMEAAPTYTMHFPKDYVDWARIMG